MWAFLLTAALLAPAQKPRLVVLTDIGGDPDDTQSMVRLMVYANEFEIEGLIASASGTPNELKQAIVQPQLIREIVEAYGRVRPNLLRHAPGYPPAEQLLSRIKAGNPRRTVADLGTDTEGSRWIVSVVDRNDPRPVNVAIWGGSHDLAQALWRVRRDRAPAEVDRFVAKLRVHAIGHQDETGPWIVANFPRLFFILSSADAGDVLGAAKGKIDRRLSVYRGMYLGGDESPTSREWIDANVRTGHGPLGALYPPKTWTAPNPHGALKEGDTPSWFYFLPRGFNHPERPDQGSWGGRFRRVRARYYEDATDRVSGVEDARATVWRWREAYQNDFAARMDWCVADKANHNPAAVLRPERLEVRAGAAVRLSAAGSRDPDGDALAYRWFSYPEAGGVAAAISGAGETLTFAAPEVSAPADLHVLLEVKDSGAPPLFAWRRAIVRVLPPQR